MWSKIGQLTVRILFIPISGLFVLQLFSLFGKSLNDIISNLTDDSSHHIFLRFDTRNTLIIWFSVFWISLHLLLELSAAFLTNFKFRRLLTNLRYAPAAIVFFSTFVVLIFDFGMIEYSKWQIRNYVFSSSESIEKPAFRPHVDYRGWCGNGYTARESDLYFDVASEGINAENPKARARALLMTFEVKDFLNGGDSAKLSKVLRKICQDSDSEVKNLAEKYLTEAGSGCQKLLSSN